MTKKDYELIARVLAQYMRASRNIDYKVNLEAYTAEICNAMAHELNIANDKFLVSRFLKACEV